VAVDALSDLQKAVYGALTGDATLMAAINGVYDFVPQTSAHPYITIGDDNYEWWGAMQQDGGKYVLQIDTWSRAEGRKEVKDIMNIIAGILHNGSLTVAGNTHISTRLQFQSTIKEADGFTHHGIQTFVVLLHE